MVYTCLHPIQRFRRKLTMSSAKLVADGPVDSSSKNAWIHWIPVGLNDASMSCAESVGLTNSRGRQLNLFQVKLRPQIGQLESVGRCSRGRRLGEGALRLI